jgi:tetratricopeptide (TPR) repeat protein
MKRRVWTIVGLALVALAVVGWVRRRAVPDVAKSPITGKPLRHRPKTSRELATTSAEIYLQNLDAQISELTRISKEKPDLVANVQRLSAAHHVRGRYRGDLDEIQLGIDGASECLRLEPGSAICFLMRAEQEQSLHRFAQARTDLERAKKLGADRARTVDLEADLDWNDGLYDRAIPAIRKARRDRPSTATWLREAQLDHDLGLEDQADAAFEAAEDLIADVAPLPLAHLDLQRGIRDTQRGHDEEACVFFREATARMPTYIAANEHLAETLHRLGKDDEAITLYEKVVAMSDDPEFFHALAVLYATHGKTDKARELEAKARASYETLLQKYPEAMYWHASEYFLEIGEKERALDLLRKNVVLRRNSASFVALARAELASGAVQNAHTSIDKALAMPVVSASLFATASAIYRHAGETEKADAFRARARALNPREEEPR